jgi:hypothetical protein
MKLDPKFHLKKTRIVPPDLWHRAHLPPSFMKKEGKQIGCT